MATAAVRFLSVTHLAGHSSTWNGHFSKTKTRGEERCFISHLRPCVWLDVPRKHWLPASLECLSLRCRCPSFQVSIFPCYPLCAFFHPPPSLPALLPGPCPPLRDERPHRSQHAAHPAGGVAHHAGKWAGRMALAARKYTCVVRVRLFAALGSSCRRSRASRRQVGRASGTGTKESLVRTYICMVRVRLFVALALHPT